MYNKGGGFMLTNITSFEKLRHQQRRSKKKKKVKRQNLLLHRKSINELEYMKKQRTKDKGKQGEFEIH